MFGRRIATTTLFLKSLSLVYLLAFLQTLCSLSQTIASKGLNPLNLPLTSDQSLAASLSLFNFSPLCTPWIEGLENWLWPTLSHHSPLDTFMYLLATIGLVLAAFLMVFSRRHSKAMFAAVWWIYASFVYVQSPSLVDKGELVLLQAGYKSLT